MFVKKLVLCLMIAFTGLATTVYAGSEDWRGTFVLRGIDGNQYTFYHMPTYVRFLFITSGTCMHLGKGSSINGLKMPENLDLCTALSVDDFTKEVEKLGTIINESIEIGPTYTV